MTFNIDLTDEVALVTGAAGGIGKAIVETLADAGARVVATDLDADGLQEAFGSHPSIFTATMNVGDAASVDQAFDEVAAEVGHPSIVVNNAGVASRVGMPFTRLDASDWDLPWLVNVVGVFLVSKAAVPAMIERSRGSIVNIASVSGRTGFQTSPPYSATKAATINLTQVMARDLAEFGIRVNSVCPGMVFTPFYREQRLAAAEADPSLRDVNDRDYFEEKATRLIPLGRGQEPEDIASSVMFLASDLAAQITGQALNVDGGLVMS